MSRERKSLGKQLTDIVSKYVTPTDNTPYVGKKIYGRAGTSWADTSGKITGTSSCRLSGCTGLRLHVLWDDGKRTYPCAKGVKTRDTGDYEIL